MSNTFQVVSGTTEYTMQLEVGTDVFVASSLNTDFSENVGVSKFSRQTQLKNVLKFGKTGDWVQVISKMSNTFQVVSGTTEYTMQHEVGTDVFVASSLNTDFSENVGVSKFSRQTQLKNVLKFGKTGDWVQVISKMSNTFQVVSGTT